jgi:hypothetical protein
MHSFVHEGHNERCYSTGICRGGDQAPYPLADGPQLGGIPGAGTLWEDVDLQAVSAGCDDDSGLLS